jgi:hypothetical protein
MRDVSTLDTKRILIYGDNLDITMINNY